MKVKRIVANVQTSDIAAAARFYGDVLGLDVLMDLGWIVTYGSGTKTTAQISFASDGVPAHPSPIYRSRWMTWMRRSRAARLRGVR
jgi:catechol 2,3-dioxygenase-like lactoylglutathione lyase family enzyme